MGHGDCRQRPASRRRRRRRSFDKGDVSECRNRSLQRMFLMIGGGEQAGSGYARIQEGWRNQHWRAPRLMTQTQPDRVRLDMPMLSLMPEWAFEDLRRRLGNRFDALSEHERSVLATALGALSPKACSRRTTSGVGPAIGCRRRSAPAMEVTPPEPASPTLTERPYLHDHALKDKRDAPSRHGSNRHSSVGRSRSAAYPTETPVRRLGCAVRAGRARPLTRSKSGQGDRPAPFSELGASRWW